MKTITMTEKENLNEVVAATLLDSSKPISVGMDLSFYIIAESGEKINVLQKAAFVQDVAELDDKDLVLQAFGDQVVDDFLYRVDREHRQSHVLRQWH